MDCVVTTVEELKAAVERKEERIVVEGELADAFRKKRKVKNVGKTIGVIGTVATIGSVIIFPVSSGVALAAFAAKEGAKASAGSILGWGFLGILGVSLMRSIEKNYEWDSSIKIGPLVLTLKAKPTNKTK